MNMHFAETVVVATMVCATMVYIGRLAVQAIKDNHKADPKVQPGVTDPMPGDLFQYAAGWGDEWARDNAMTRLSELYGQLGDWDKVRKIVGSRG